MRRRDEGAALVEFVVLVPVIAIPLALGIQAVAEVHAAAVATSAAAREAARTFTSASSAESGYRVARAAAHVAVADAGFDLPATALRMDCGSSRCLAPRSAVVATVSWELPLSWLPWPLPSSIALTAEERAVVDSFRADPPT